MQSWREHMPRGMLLKSEGFASSLYDPDERFSLGRFCESAGLPYKDIGEPVPLERFVTYGLEFQRRLVPELERHTIERLSRRGGGYALTTSTGEQLSARCVIVATGISHFGHIPPELGNQPAELVSHSSAHSKLDGFRDKTVAVIGAGSSAIDIVALLSEAGANVHLIARRDAIDFHDPPAEPRRLGKRLLAPRSGLGTGWRSRLCTDAPLLFHLMPESFRLRVVKRHLGPAPGWFMRDRVAGRFPMHLGTSIVGLKENNGTVRLTLARKSGGSTTLEVAHVIAATGYKPAIRHLPFLTDELRDQILTADEAPILNRNFQCSVPDLYWVGLASANCFGPLTRFAYGAKFTARRLTRILAGVLRFDADPANASQSSSAAP